MEEGKVQKPRENNMRPGIAASLLLCILQCVKEMVSYLKDAEAHLRKSVLSLGEKDSILSDHERRKVKQSKLKQIITPLRTGRLGFVLFVFAAVGILGFISQDTSLQRVEEEFERAIATHANTKISSSFNPKIKIADEEILPEGWPNESAHISSLRRRAAVGTLRVGLLNLQPTTDIGEWKFLTGDAPIAAPMKSVAETVGWIHLFPEWIDEEAKYGSPKCPIFPMPQIPPVPYVSEAVQLDVVIARAPCTESAPLQEGWKQPAILQVLLGAANLASETGRESIFVLILSKCRPLVNLFPCGELLEHRDEGWLYHMNVQQLKKRTSLPIGTCQLSVHLDKFYVPDYASDIGGSNSQREAFATILHSGAEYVCGAIAAAQSIRSTGSTKDLVALVDDNISSEHRKGLEEAGWKVRDYSKIQASSNLEKHKDFSMLRLWQLDYDKVIYLDSDIIVLRNIDHLFRLPEVSASGTSKSSFYNGLMVIEPSNCTFHILMDELEKLVGEVMDVWEFFNRVFPWWHRIPRYMNTLKYFWNREQKQLDYMNRLFSSNPSELYAIHYVSGQKPWKCFRDYDCNWNTDEHCASDEAHAQWFKVYDQMPGNLQQFCGLSTSAKAELEHARTVAQSNDLPDKHWAINITDPRSNVCQGSHCDWELCQQNHCDWNAMLQPVTPVVNSSQTVDNATEQTVDNATEQTGDNATEQTGDNATEQTGDNATEQMGDNATEQTADNASEQTVANTTEQTVDNTTEQTVDNTTEQRVDNTTEQTVDNTTEHTVDNTTSTEVASEK